MALTQRLQMRQSQALVMTPQLMQAIKLLQLSNLDLVAYVEGELERNPLLERTGEGPADATQPGEATPTLWGERGVNGAGAVGWVEFFTRPNASEPADSQGCWVSPSGLDPTYEGPDTR